MELELLKLEIRSESRIVLGVIWFGRIEERRKKRIVLNCKVRMKGVFDVSKIFVV